MPARLESSHESVMSSDNDACADCFQAVIICACPLEYRICRHVLSLQDERPAGGRAISSGSLGKTRVGAVFAGPGKINCAASTQLVIDCLEPDLIIAAGAAGSLSQELGIGDIVCIRRSFEYDIFPLEKSKSHAGELISRTLLDSQNLEEMPAWLSELSSWAFDRSEIKMMVGDVACGERNVENEGFRRELSKTLRAVACDWETSAVLSTANRCDVPALGFRTISDNAGSHMRAEFQKNIRVVLTNLFLVLERFFKMGACIDIAEKHVGDC